MDNKNSANTFFIKTIKILTAVFPAALSMCVCSGLGTFAGVTLSCLFALLYNFFKTDKASNYFLIFLVISFCLNGFGVLTALAAIILCLALLSIFKSLKTYSKKPVNTPAECGIMLSTALTVTVLFTTLYFGIGANGNNVREMIASYLSLGFHPNWRGVLYGTIVMVIMITFPRKFKNFSKTVSAPFLAIIITVALNFILNPPDMITAISEIGAPSFSQFRAEIYSSAGSFSVINAVLSAIAMFFASLPLFKDKSNNNIKKITFSDIAPNLTAAVVIAVICFVCSSLISRIPVHSCAVVIIVSAWQSVKWNKFKDSFSNLSSVICFASVFVSVLIFGVVYGTLISAYISILYLLFSKKQTKDF